MSPWWELKNPDSSVANSESQSYKAKQKQTNENLTEQNVVHNVFFASQNSANIGRFFDGFQMIWHIVLTDDDFAISRSTVQKILRQIDHVDVAGQTLDEIGLKQRGKKKMSLQIIKDKPRLEISQIEYDLQLK